MLTRTNDIIIDLLEVLQTADCTCPKSARPLHEVVDDPHFGPRFHVSANVVSEKYCQYE